MTTTRPLALSALTAGLALGGAGPAAADGFDRAQAESRIKAAGYADVEQVHEGNLGDWMAQATREGRHVMVVLHADGTVALRQQDAEPPVKPMENPAAPAKP